MLQNSVSFGSPFKPKKDSLKKKTPPKTGFLRSTPLVKQTVAKLIAGSKDLDLMAVLAARKAWRGSHSLWSRAASATTTSDKSNQGF